MVKKIISGAQVGADIAGLRAGKELGLETGGYVTRGCKTKNGYEPHLIDEYGLTELETEDYPSRTAHNVSQSHGTLRAAHDWSSRGELCTLKFMKYYQRPYFNLPLCMSNESMEWRVCSETRAVLAFRDWLQNHAVEVLNVAGNADTSIESTVYRFLIDALRTDGG